MTAEEFTLPEAEIVTSLGLARALVREVRGADLIRGQDWQHVQGTVRYSTAGRDRLLARLNVVLTKKKSEGADASVHPLAPEPGDHRELICEKKPRNRRIVFARLGDALVRVRVKDSTRILPGMTLRCAFVQADLWELAQPLPRSRGRW